MTGYLITKANRDYHPWEIGCIRNGAQCGVIMVGNFDDVLRALKEDRDFVEKKEKDELFKV